MCGSGTARVILFEATSRSLESKVKMSTNDPSSPTIPLTDSQILFVSGFSRREWRARLRPFKRWLYAASIAIGSALGAATYFALH